MATLNANPYFEVDASDWQVFGGSAVRSTAQAHEGVASLLLTPDGVTETARVECLSQPGTGGSTYRFSAWVRCAVARTISTSMNWFSAGSGYLSTTNGPSVSVAANTWTQLTMVANIPANAARVSGNVRIFGTPTSASLLHIDEARLEDAALGVVAIYNGSYHSPGFGLTVTGLSGYTTLTIERIDTTGEYPDTPVRGADGVAISSGTFAVTDYEPPVGKAVVYRATASTPASSVSGTSSPLGISDTFSRTASSGWGSPDIGPAWAIRSGPIPDFSVTSGVGRMSMTQRSVSGNLGTEYVMGSALNHTNIDQTVKFRPVAIPAGDTLRFALVARETDRNNWWEFETGFLTDGSMQVRIGREVNGASIYENPVTVPTTFAAGSWYWMRFQVIGSTLRGRVWKDGTTEQSSWDMQITSTLLASGNFVGVKTFSSAFSSNPTPEVVEFDNYSLTILDNTTVINANDAGTTWLKSVGQPALSRRVNMVEFDEHSRPGRILGEYEVLGRQNKVVLTDTLGGREGSLTLVTYQMNGVWESDSYWRDIQSLISKGGTLLLQTAGTTFTAEDDMYLEVKNLSRKRVGLVGGELVHLHTIDFIEVDRPASTQEALSLRNWQSVLDQNGTWQDVLTNHTSWLDVLQRDT